jgi:hypothetical protein
MEISYQEILIPASTKSFVRKIPTAPTLLIKHSLLCKEIHPLSLNIPHRYSPKMILSRILLLSVSLTSVVFAKEASRKAIPYEVANLYEIYRLQWELVRKKIEFLWVTHTNLERFETFQQQNRTWSAGQNWGQTSYRRRVYRSHLGPQLPWCNRRWDQS